MSSNNNIQVVDTSSKEFSIHSTNRPYYAHITQVCSSEGHYRFAINAGRVDLLVFKILSAVEEFSADEVVAALGVAFILICRRFQFSVPDYLNFVENFLKADDLKLGCHAMQRMFQTYYKELVTRHERIEFEGVAKMHFDKPLKKDK